MIALNTILPGATVTLGAPDTSLYEVKLNAGSTLILTRDEQEFEFSYAEARRLGLFVAPTFERTY